MTQDLERRLHDLADDAPPGLAADGLWGAGLRRHRTRRAGALATAALALTAVVGGLQLTSADTKPGPADVPAGTGHLPRTVHVPAAWSEGTGDAGELGPLAAIGSSDRKRPLGLLGMVAYEGMYGVSAVDGTVRFLDLPTSANEDMPGELDLRAALSPDGRKVAYARYDWDRQTNGGDAPLLGWGVYDTTSGRTVELADPDAPVLRDDAFQPVFSGDSKYLVTVYAGADESADDPGDLVAWDVDSGRPLILKQPRASAPQLGSGPDGVVWSRGTATVRVDPVSSSSRSVITAKDVVSASFAPSGTAFAYVGGTLGSDGIEQPWSLYAGTSPDQLRKVPGLSDASLVLGWRDAEHVVVATSLQDYAVVDVTDGSAVRGSLGGEVNFNASVLASDLWANSLVDGAEPPGAGDPRTPSRLVAVGVVLLGGLTVLLVRRRRRG